MWYIYYGGHADFSIAGAWYQPYVDYAIPHGMLEKTPTDPLRPATRAELAALLAASLSEWELAAHNSSASFTDVKTDHPAYPR